MKTQKNFFFLFLLLAQVASASIVKSIEPPKEMLDAYRKESKIKPKDKALVRCGLKWDSWSKVEEALLKQIEQLAIDDSENGMKRNITVVLMVTDPSKKVLKELVNEPKTSGYIVKGFNDRDEISLSINDAKVTNNSLKTLEKLLTNATKEKEHIAQIHRAHNIEKILKYLNMQQTPELKQSITEGKVAITLTLSYEALLDLLKYENNIISSVGLPKKDEELSMSSAIDASEMTYFVNYANSGARGADTKIYYRELNNCPDPRLIDTSLYSTINGQIDAADHPILTGGILHTISPAAQILCMDNRNRTNTNPFSTTAENATLENHSWSVPNLEVYSDIDMMFDNHVHQTRKIIFVAAGNRKTSAYDYVTTPAKALNVISVGNYVDTMHPYQMNKDGNKTSSYKNSDIGNQKPEISAPGTNIEFTPLVYYTIDGEPIISPTITDTGTSFASPHAAAFAANYISGTENSSEFLRATKSPAMLKSLMIASATNTISDGIDRSGEGGINFDIAYNHWEYMGYWYDPDGVGPFPENYPYSVCSTVYSNLQLSSNPNQKARFSLAWLNRGDFIMQHGYTGLDLRLLIQRKSDGKYYYNNFSAGSNSYDNLEILNPNGLYDVMVCRLRNDDPDVHIDFGYTVTIH